jgi:hypothetical protein
LIGGVPSLGLILGLRLGLQIADATEEEGIVALLCGGANPSRGVDGVALIVGELLRVLTGMSDGLKVETRSSGLLGVSWS